MLATTFAWIVVALHVLFAFGETLAWPQMARRFGIDREAAEASRALAFNQGAYNAGLACLLGWALLGGHAATVTAVLLYVVAMAVVGALSVRWTILVGQGVPALAALLAAGLG